MLDLINDNGKPKYVPIFDEVEDIVWNVFRGLEQAVHNIPRFETTFYMDYMEPIENLKVGILALPCIYQWCTQVFKMAANCDTSAATKPIGCF